MEITLLSRHKRVSQKLEQQFQWYDHVSKRMLRGTGGEMRFRYENGRSIPYLVDREVYVRKNDYDNIVEWLEKHKNEISVLSMNRGHSVLIDVDPNVVDEITYSLVKHNIMYQES